MNEDIMRAAGFGKQVDLVKRGRCPTCRAWIKTTDEGEIVEFRDEISLKEYKISGMCQRCQDEVFRGPDDE
jgi:hypothetical protein